MNGAKRPGAQVSARATANQIGSILNEFDRLGLGIRGRGRRGWRSAPGSWAWPGCGRPRTW